MSTQRSISRFLPGFIPLLSLYFSLFLLICIGPVSTQCLAAQVTLAWDANTDPGVAGYKLYYGTASRTYGTPVDVGKVTQHTLSGIEEGKNSYFAVTAYDTNWNESAFSTELECFSIVPAPGVNGAISPSISVVVSRGMSQSFTVTPAVNYAIADVLVDGVTKGPVETFSFTNIDRNHILSASFASVSYSHIISASAGANGSINPSGDVSVAQGGSQTFMITANEGYQVQDVLVDNTSVGAATSYTISNVSSARSIYATFKAKAYTIFASSDPNGTINPQSSSVSYGGSQTFTITANEGYQVQDVLVDNKSVGNVTSYSISNVTSEHSIYATFKAKTYTISTSAGPNGTINPLSSSVTYGGNETFTITANSGYKVKDVLVDDISVGAVTSHPFNNVSADHSISVSFESCNAAILSLNFEEGSGNTAVDSSGSENHGTINGAVYTTDSAVASYALSFDGNSLATVPAKENLEPSNLSVSVWVKHTNDTNSSCGGILQGGGGGNSNGFRVLDYQNKPLGQISFGDTEPKWIFGNTFVDGEWTHMVLTYNHEKVSFYQNGELVSEVAETRDINWDSDASDLTIGLAQWYFKGMIDKLQMFNYALSSQEVGQLYAEENTNPGITYTITATAGANGTISPSGSISVNSGDSQTFTFTPAANYKVSSVTVDGESMGELTSFTFSNITANHSITAAFELNTYAITATAGANGTISPSGSISVNSGDSQTFTFTPAANYKVSNVTVDGVSVGAVTSYTFSNVTSTHVIAATFAFISSNTYTISASAGVGGQISPSGTVILKLGASKTFKFTPINKNYLIDKVFVDGISVGAPKYYTFSRVKANHKISVTFKYILATRIRSSKQMAEIASSQMIDTEPGYLLAGSGQFPGSGGWIEILTHQGEEGALPVHIDWPEYNKLSGETRLATGDLDGDGRDEIIVGLGPVQGAPGIPGGYFIIFDDDYSVITWGLVEWPEYNQINGETRPACGDIDGDGIAEIIIGLGPGGEGRLEVLKLTDHQLKHVNWLRTGWLDYNRGNGETRPACGDLNGDGKDEVVVGLGPVKGNPDIPGGVFFIFDQTSIGSADLQDSGQSDASGWGVISWPEYNRTNGESWPACGDVNGDGKDEIVLGLGKQGQGRFEILGFDLIQNLTQQIAWQQSLFSTSEIHPACGRLESDAGDEIVIGSSKDGNNFLEVFANADQDFQPIRRVQSQLKTFRKQGGVIWPAVFQTRDQ